jgi:hypothetical protein
MRVLFIDVDGKNAEPPNESHQLLEGRRSCVGARSSELEENS